MSNLPCPLYTSTQSVKVRLANKVQFQEDPEVVAQGELSNEFLNQLIVDAETDVEQELRGRYAVPFRSKKTNQWADLPDHTKRAIRQAVDMRAVMNVLEIDFGRGTHIDSDNYKDPLAAHYKALIQKLMGQDVEGKERDRHRFSPPLEDLLLAASNSEADDGLKGMVINTDGLPNTSDYAATQINNPAENYYITGALRPRGF